MGGKKSEEPQVEIAAENAAPETAENSVKGGAEQIFSEAQSQVIAAYVDGRVTELLDGPALASRVQELVAAHVAETLDARANAAAEAEAAAKAEAEEAARQAAEQRAAEEAEAAKEAAAEEKKRAKAVKEKRTELAELHERVLNREMKRQAELVDGAPTPIGELLDNCRAQILFSDGEQFLMGQEVTVTGDDFAIEGELGTFKRTIDFQSDAEPGVARKAWLVLYDEQNHLHVRSADLGAGLAAGGGAQSRIPSGYLAF